MSVRLGLLWHLHQPDYRDPTTGRPAMPWARLHALRGYRDLLLEAVEHDVAMTINVVPSLWDQLLHYAEGGDDRHLELTRMPAAALDPPLAAELVATLPGGHPMITEAWPVYARLRRRLSGGPPWTLPDLRDLQVWATLAWFGATAHRDAPELGVLAIRGQGFTEADKAAVLAVHDRILAEMPGLLDRLVRAPGPSLSTSPYYHPILPLLIDAGHARRSMPDLPDEVRFAWPQDALRQLVDARERVKALSGEAPQGLWPSEGSVSPETVALAAEAGFRWLVSDRGVLERSRATPADELGAWDLGHGMVGFFRDTDLSDRIGFQYARWDPHQAAADLVAAVAAGEPGVATVALDGENPWESFADAGGAFRRALYAALARGPVRAVTFDEAAAEPPVGRVTRLHTGSWIGADFRIWIGHPADREAWRALATARGAVETAPARKKEAAMKHLLAAEGSDWTWWYGDEFRTEWDGAFDALFRGHLRAAYDAIGQSAPAELEHPIGGAGAPLQHAPGGFLSIDWDTAGAWLRWLPAGTLRAWGGSMAAGSAVLEVRYGWSAAPGGGVGPLWLRIATRGDHWRVLEPATAVEVRALDQALVVRIDGPWPTRIQLAGPIGEVWPPEPVSLRPPDHPELAWWET